MAVLSLLLTACGVTTRHQEPGANAGSNAEGGGAAHSGGSSAGSRSRDPTNGVLCPSLEQAPDSLLLAARQGSKRALVRADGAVHLRHTVPFDFASEVYLGADAELFFAAVQSGLSVDVTERRWQLAHFGANGGLLGTGEGVLPVPSDVFARVYAPAVSLQDGSIAFEQADGDTWLVDFDGTAELRECEQRTPIGSAEGGGFIGAWIEGMYGDRTAAFVDVQGGTCRRLPNVDAYSGATSFLQGRFQYVHAASGSLLLSDEGPSSISDTPLWPADAGAAATLHAISDDVLYVLSAPKLARYDAVAKELQLVTLPSATTWFALYGDRLVGVDQGLPRWSYDLVQQTLIQYDLDTPAGMVTSQSSGDFFLISVDDRPTTWLNMMTGEARPFEVAIPVGSTLETIAADTRELLVADGLPIAHVDLGAGRATALELPRSSGRAETFRSRDVAFVVLDGVPALRVDLESGLALEVKGAAGLSGPARCERIGEHVVVSSEGRPRAILDAESAELLPLDSADQVPAATTFSSNERYVVGFDDRLWPVFRIDVPKREVVGYAVAEPGDLAGFRDPRYLETPGDTLYEQYYASSLPDAEVLEDGSALVALRDARHGRLWLVSPEDTAFRPLGRPVTGVIGLNWYTKEYSVQIAGDRGDCYCQPPSFRWEQGDADVVPSGSVQLVSRAHPSLVIVSSDYLVEEDTSGVCVVESASVPLVHDLLAGTTERLEGVDGEVRFLQVAK